VNYCFLRTVKKMGSKQTEYVFNVQFNSIIKLVNPVRLIL